MGTIWQQYYIRGILAIAVALALPWHCIVHCAPHVQPQQRAHFVCDMFQTATTSATSQPHLTSNTPRPHALHVAIIVRHIQPLLPKLTTDYATLIVLFVGIVMPPATHPPQYQPFFFSFV